ncbi:Precorrin-6Y C(5,15)-methyltransferase [decarboxylating] [Roseimaritima multifibrata]|uniref:Precorrin-6Y C(5,15)-methyltransferase [decarboxylating] n=1 Tax=Roseimaritima multifibrata TaxID=1930274 RepID=A0A517MCC1_9BACT|nr:precorrin-6y C5,15-methyltransferase (decarboxylating) subunit CbiE [Roseimaritima multifibrata]QDS92543.1 Precorrin-6Y C(5,15)-methyltransferase [decarboxylating] [Roseimaritima multifibrata]
MESAPRIQIIGIGDDGQNGLTQHACHQIEQAELLLGNASLLKRFEIGPSERIEIGSDLDELCAAVEKVGNRRAVLLASGDPLFYGIANFLCEKLGKDRFEVLPHVSTMQLAFARVMESWDDAYLSNLATQPLDRVVDTIRTSERAGLFTTDEITPAVVAEALLDRRINYFTAYVCENLGTPAETVTQAELGDLKGQTFAPLNVMVLVRKRGAADRPSGSERRRRFGNPDDMFLQSRPKRGLITPAEVRCIALAELDLMPESTLWDVGAGSGALAIEAAGLAHLGKVYAIEMDAEDYGLMVENAARFECPNLVPIHGQAPEAWADLPIPDAIFVGGSGRMVPDLVRDAIQHLGEQGRIVINVSSPDNLLAVQQQISAAGLKPEVRMINIARGHDQLDRTRFEALNPTFLITGTSE